MPGTVERLGTLGRFDDLARLTANRWAVGSWSRCREGDSGQWVCGSIGAVFLRLQGQALLRTAHAIRAVCHLSTEVSVTRDELFAALEEYYRSCGLRPERAPDGTVRARGFGGVTWIGLPVSGEDLDDAGFEARLIKLGDEKMPTGELCPLELLPSPDCAERLYALLERVGLGERGNVEVYAAA